MPTSNPRLSITLDPAFDAVLDRLSRLMSRPKSSIIMDVLGPAQPFFEETANLLERAQQVHSEPSRQIAEMKDRLIDRATSMEGLPPRAESLLRELAHVLEDDSPEGLRPPVQ